MKEVKSPKKPLLYYYGIVLLVLVIFNVIVTPMITKSMVREVDYGTFMSKIEDKKIEDVQIEDNQILFIALGNYMGRKMMNQAGGKNSMAFGMGKSNAKVYVP